MRESDFRHRIGRFILISNAASFCLILLGVVAGGFTGEELKVILAALLPVQTVYMTAVIKYMVANKVQVNESKNSKLLNKGYVTTVRVIIGGHIFILCLLIVLHILGGSISKEMIGYLLLITETFFGAYIGTLIGSLFHVENPNKYINPAGSESSLEKDKDLESTHPEEELP